MQTCYRKFSTIRRQLERWKKVSEDSYILSMDMEGNCKGCDSVENHVKLIDGSHSSSDERSQHKKIRSTIQDSMADSSEERDRTVDHTLNESSKRGTASGSSCSSRSQSPEITSPITLDDQNKAGSKGSAILKFETEKEVFDFLGFPWFEPHERNL
ncbi:DNA polymerase beta thumb domain-containing protein [Forsythia ovata]|uniref:DNA polymerase beta thumb domain-containing protein n=1 Tax=Forsythia ovata TaxID=205694 RepID=A0ABD1TC03_9LAMI